MHANQRVSVQRPSFAHCNAVAHLATPLLRIRPVLGLLQTLGRQPALRPPPLTFLAPHCRASATAGGKARNMADDSTTKVTKRKAKEAVEDGGAKRAAPGTRLVNPKRVRELNAGDVGEGPVLYWCAAPQVGRMPASSLPSLHRARLFQWSCTFSICTQGNALFSVLKICCLSRHHTCCKRHEVQPRQDVP